MHKDRGLLLLPDPLGGAQMQIEETKGLVFTENEPFLSQAQAALWQKRRRHGWVCIAAQGEAASIALALAAQLPVDRVAILSPGQNGPGLPREMRRLKAFARRNLALVTAEILLIGAQEALAHEILRGNRHCQLCVLDAMPPEGLTAPWERICEKNLLIQGKCV